MMKLEFILILGFPFIKITRKKFVDLLESHIKTEEKAFVVTGNPEIVMQSLQDKDYENCIRKADYITADGIGIVKASNIRGNPLPERVSGYDIMLNLFTLSQKKNYKVFLLGATEPVLQATVDRARKLYPGINITGQRNGYFEWGDTTVVKDIKDADADMIFVALGCPLQEKWIAQNIHHFDKGVFMGIGGGFDVLAGKVKRAPEKWQKMNLEWFYRLVKQPSRWKRMKYLPHFAFVVLLGKFYKRDEK